MYLVENPELLAGYRCGEATALHQIYLHYAPLLYRYLQQGFRFHSQGRPLYTRVTDPVLQESLVQETFVRCFEEKVRQRYDGQRPFLRYLQRTCQNLLLEEKRKEKRYKWLEEPAEIASQQGGLPGAGSESPHHAIEEEELQRSLESFLGHCSLRERQVFQSLYEEGDTQEEAARRLGLGRSQIRTSLQKLRRSLLRHFRDTGYLEAVKRPRSLSRLFSFLL